MNYEEAVCALNTLQTNASVLDQVRKERSELPDRQLQAMYGFLHRTGLTVEDLDPLNIIHVTGTKGKGSTCAFTERILRGYGFRTGFYSSPHLIQVRERIRINGQPISKELFTKYFWEVYDQLDGTQGPHGGSMPGYFCFLTILAFHVFLRERVDLAVVEVGIGGAYDCTNIIRKPWVCGISSLEIDHMSILGDSIEEIAWQKAGIFKPGVPGFTVRQPAGPMTVIKDRAKEKGCPLWVCPDLEQYETGAGPVHLSLAGQQQHCNASLALQLSKTWLERYRQSVADVRLVPPTAQKLLVSQAPAFQPSSIMLKGLEATEWPGRTQTLRHGPITYYLDGAHTTGSMQACVHWFRQQTQQEEGGHRGPVVRVLLFNATGERDSAALLKLLVPCQFDFTVFCPNITETITENNADQQNFNVSMENVLTRCLDNQSSWQRLSETETQQGSELLIPDRLPLLAKTRTHTLVFPCILSALQWIGQERDGVLAAAASSLVPVQTSVLAKATALKEAAHISVLVTGSLHLVGGALKHLDPSIAS
ncbi:folylpolyglutamate synthase, mitochondrial isoform X1 [Esox lucius]|uniref:Folylpolyglutamate synthase n=1 Tax=Esox lucius TaxID=8010 RepID=A0AAY5LDK1_ESOLU|nr:folylpolyglutamate synthase, mitochondrial isoform X1 [Esox lucius]